MKMGHSSIVNEVEYEKVSIWFRGNVSWGRIDVCVDAYRSKC